MSKDVILKRPNHTEWVKNESVIYQTGDRLTVSDKTYEDFKFKFDLAPQLEEALPEPEAPVVEAQPDLLPAAKKGRAKRVGAKE